MQKSVKIVIAAVAAIILVPIVFFSVLMGALSAVTTSGLISREEVVQLYQKNEAVFLDAAASEAFSDLEILQGVQKVSVKTDHADIRCGSAGMGSNTSYFGIFYSAKDDLYAIWCAPPRRETLEPQRSGYQWKEKDGDNVYYVESLGNHFFYYEAKF